MSNEIADALKVLTAEIRDLRLAVENLNELIDDLSTDVMWPGNATKALQVTTLVGGTIEAECTSKITAIAIETEDGPPLSDIIEYGIKEPLKKLGEDIKDAVDNLNL